MKIVHEKDRKNIKVDGNIYTCNFSIHNEEGLANNATYGLKQFIYKPKDIIISPEGCQKEHVGSLVLYKAYSMNAWLKTFRSDAYKAEIADNNVRLTWKPVISHQIETIVEYQFTDKNYIDIHISIESYGYYPKYEIILSNYLFSNFVNSVIVRDEKLTKRKVMLHTNPFYRDTYLFFPRDEQALSIMTDGRHQKGHWLWDCSYGREYYLPMVVSENDDVEVILMGLKSDTHAVGATYSDQNDRDDIVEHYAQYVRLFGEDITPGTKKGTVARCYLKEKITDASSYEKLYEEFQSEYRSKNKTLEMKPHVKYGYP